MGEVVAFEQQRFAAGHGQRVGEAVTEVQAGRVPTLAEPLERGAGDAGLFGIDRDDFAAGLLQQAVERLHAARAVADLQHDGRLHVRGGRQQAGVGPLDGGDEGHLLRFTGEDGNQGRGVQDHQRGRPCSS